MKATRATFGETIRDLGKTYKNIVVLDADLAKSTKSEMFGKAYPDRFFECGIAESNMIGIAAGLALAGKRAFACSFGCFLIGRFETIRMSVAYNKAPVVLVGTHAGVSIGEDGHSQMALEDISLMRSLPNMHIFQPTDETDTQQIVEFIAKNDFYAYLRLTRQDMENILPKDYTYEPFKGHVMTETIAPEDADCVLFVTGGPASAALQAVKVLNREGLKIACVIMNSLWPLDQDWLNSTIPKNVKALISVEDHYVVGGLGSILGENSPRPLPILRIGIDQFGQSGTSKDVIKHYGLNNHAIAEKVGTYCRSQIKS
jgi:transketolase